MLENSQKIYGLRWTVVCAAAVFVFAIVAFIRASGYGLVNFDDYLYLLVGGSLVEQFALRTRDEGSAPEGDAG